MILLAVFVLVVFVLGGLILIDQVDPSLTLRKKVPVMDLCFNGFVVVGVAVFVYVLFYQTVFFMIVNNLPNVANVSYTIKAEFLLDDIKDESGGGSNIFLVQSGTSYYCHWGNELWCIPIRAVKEIKINKGSARKVQLLSADFTKRWYKIVLFAFGPFPLEKKYKIFLQDEAEVVRGSVVVSRVFNFQKEDRVFNFLLE